MWDYVCISSYDLWHLLALAQWLMDLGAKNKAAVSFHTCGLPELWSLGTENKKKATPATKTKTKPSQTSSRNRSANIFYLMACEHIKLPDSE